MRRRQVGLSVLALGLLLTGCSDSTGSSGDSLIIESMTQDLTRLLAVQDSFHLNNADYAGSMSPAASADGIGGSGIVHFVASYQTLVTMTYVDANGWSASAANPVAVGTPSQCGIFAGMSANSPTAAVTQERTVACG